ncbi:SWI/SNF-related matrix-associated actin-dependent regulator of chromatin subfamily A-like protein 1 [Parasteatoda tepidariorum]|nr:SWI/SNF-related matrix-associated actin-dependent regulator of chromatin subfamily A-like protein 1 [Parasteatoda tepidariorum]
MSQLTEEQRKRIEENRRKALEIRAKRSANESNFSNCISSSAPATTKSKNFVSSVSSAKSIHRPFLLKDPEGNFTVSARSLSSKFKPNETLLNNKTSENIKTKNPFEIRVKGPCVLVSRKRFFVNIGYNKELIDVFKSIPSKLYDAQTKKWNFHIDDHDKLINLARPLQPKTFVIPLPKFILKIFSNASENRKIDERDLSSLDPKLQKSLLPFQKEGVYFALQRGGKVLIADDMGLGKTIQAIAIANYFSKDWPLLVVTPSSLRYAWFESFCTWLPSIDKQEIGIISSGKDHIPNNKVVIISYDLLSKLQEAIIARGFKSVIFDESHFLKNHKAVRTKASQAVMRGMNRIIMLSGTPVLSRPIELFTQISALRRDLFSYKEYGMRYCNGKEMPWGLDFFGSSNMEELQLVLEEVLMIRRLKSDVLKQLPAKIRQMIVLNPTLSKKSSILKMMSSRVHEENLQGMEKRAALLEYYHETGQVKLKAVVEYITDLLESEKKFICFAHHRNVMDGISAAIEAKKVDYIRIDGNVSSEDKKKLCDKFQLNDACRVAVLSITSANCGLTLTAASLVVFAELFWNPGILTQAEDRAHRIGQEDSVVVQYLVAKGTADDDIWPLVQLKLDVLNKAGLSKDNFKSADTLQRNDVAQTCLSDFWGDLNETLDISDADFDLSCDIPEKRLKLDEE